MHFVRKIDQNLNEFTWVVRWRYPVTARRGFPVAARARVPTSLRRRLILGASEESERNSGYVTRVTHQNRTGPDDREDRCADDNPSPLTSSHWRMGPGPTCQLVAGCQVSRPSDQGGWWCWTSAWFCRCASGLQLGGAAPAPK